MVKTAKPLEPVYRIWCIFASCLFSFIIATNPVEAVTYYCDPVNGNTVTGDGSIGNPWGTLESTIKHSKFNGTDVKSGDTVKLLTGFHGMIDLASPWPGLNKKNSDYIYIEADTGAIPDVNFIRLDRAEYWHFKGLRISPSFSNQVTTADKTNMAYIISANTSSAKYITIEDCNIFTTEDISKWDAEDWHGLAYNAIRFAYPLHVKLHGNYIRNVSTAIGTTGNTANPGSYLTIEENTIDGFGADAISITCAHSIIQDNIILNVYEDNKSGTHSDALQFKQLLPYSALPIHDVIIRRNYVCARTDPNRSLASAGYKNLQGFFLDGLSDGIIENNVILCGNYSWGLTLNSYANNVKIINNTIVGCYGLGGEPSINISSSAGKWGSKDVIVRNNIAHKFPTDSNNPPVPGPDYYYQNVVVEHNFNIVDDYDRYFEFASYIDGDVNLADNSNFIDAGSSADALNEDIYGVSRPQGHGYDVGAYEYIPNPHAPVFDFIGNKSVYENDTLTFNVNATDPDGDAITYSIQNKPSGATFSGQTFTWTPSYNQAGTYQVTFIASDGNLRDSKTITITVSHVNQPPVLGSIANQSIDENSLLSFSVNATDPEGEAIKYSVSDLPTGAVFSGQTFTWTPSYTQAGSHDITFTASDGTAEDSQAMTITVNNVNRTPALTSIGNKSVYASQFLTFSVHATDPDGGSITYSATDMPSGATFASQTFNWTPNSSQAGIHDVTFTASDGENLDSETITITVDIDTLAPTVTNCSPNNDAIQVPLNNIISLSLTDAGTGVDTDSVTIRLNSNIIYTGDTKHYISSNGNCHRRGTPANYTFIYQSNETFDYDQTMTITVNAKDIAENPMTEYSSSFTTEMRAFGKNKRINSAAKLDSDKPVTVCDSNGNIWAAWHAGPSGQRDIYVGKLAAGSESFGSAIRVTKNSADQCQPAIALGNKDRLYVVWQDNREGDWDIYISSSNNGTGWTAEKRVNDPNKGNQTNPDIVIDNGSPNRVHVVWQDDRLGNQDICISTSNNSFGAKSVTQVTNNSADQTEPAVTADSTNTIYVVWTDTRGGSHDIYGAASNNSWANVKIISNAANQSSPAVAAESAGSILHILWTDDTPGDNDIYYASSNGLPGSPITGSSIVDDSSGANQQNPSITVKGSAGNNLKVFACWQDYRNTDTDLYFVELSSGSGATNIFVGDEGSNTYQGNPAIGIDDLDHPYLLWVDNRNTYLDIYYTGSTFVEPDSLALATKSVNASSNNVVGTNPASISNKEDVSITVSAGTCSCDVEMTISRINNPQNFTAPCLSSYDFGPSGIQFNQPVTVTIPYSVSSSTGSALPYWYNSLTGALSQQGITDVRDIAISPTLHAISFKTTHFTPFYVLGGGGGIAGALGGGGGGGGGCSLSAGNEGNIFDFILPYIGLAVVMLILKVRDVRQRKASHITAGKC
ncbi:MAG: putative Ig domain-containing protein [Phycisphaerales bacterium]|jgi:hypothetical protein